MTILKYYSYIFLEEVREIRDLIFMYVGAGCDKSLTTQQIKVFLGYGATYLMPHSSGRVKT